MALDLGAITVDALMIRSLVRDPVSYFRSYRNYFVGIYGGFLLFPGSDLIPIFLSQNTFWMRLAMQIFITGGCLVAGIWGYVATKLYLYPEPFSLQGIVSKLRRPIFQAFLLYLVPMALGISIGWLYPPAILIDSSVKVTYVIEGIMLPSAVLSLFLLGVGAAIVVAFTVYPFVVLTRLRSQMKDKEVRGALRVFRTAFSAIAMALFVWVALSAQGYSIGGSVNLLSVTLLIVAVRSFRKPTFLKSFLGVVPSLESSPSVSHADQTVLIYRRGAEKFGPISRYIMEAVGRRCRVIYFHLGDEALIRDGLSRESVDVRQQMLKGVLRLSPLGTIYQIKGELDETPIELTQELATEARTLGKDGLMVILDYDDFVIRPTQKFVQHLTDPRWATPDHYVHVLMAFSTGAFQGEEASLAQLEGKIRTLDLSESADVFSRTLGLSHQELSGKKVLLEFDPESDYERIYRSLLTESASNFERTVIFTRKDSSVYSFGQKQPGAKLFIMTPRVSYPREESENLVLLPAYDTSLLLDSLNKTVEAYAGTSFTIMFDNISHYIFTLGPERTHSLVRQALELMISGKITAVFSINSKAHDQKIMSTFESMFDIEIVCKAGATVPELKRKLSLPPSQ